MALRLAFGTNMAGIPQTRVFWASLCELARCPFVVTETGAVESLRRELLETERRWKKNLTRAAPQLGVRWNATERRRLSTDAARAARDWLAEQLALDDGPYHRDARRNRAIDDFEEWLDENIDERIFDMDKANGIRDRKIVIEAMARGYDIIVSDNIETIESTLLQEWVGSPVVRERGVVTEVLPPQPAERKLRRASQMPVEWCAWAAAQAAVTNPDHEERAADEVLQMLDVFERRGMANIALLIERTTRTPAAFESALERVRRHGNSAAARAEWQRERHELNAVARRAGLAPATLATSMAP